jgi:sua5/yciO/yrdC/ywlC family protein
MIVENILDNAVISALQSDRLIIAKTDTIYGVLARAESKKAIERLYKVKQRPLDKSVIVLASDITDIPGLTPHMQEKYQKLATERPTTIIVNVSPDFLPHIPHINGTLAFRVVPESPLSELIQAVGYLVAPSANLSGQKPAKNIAEAVNYFHESVAIYVDSGEIVDSKPSQIIHINDHGEIEFIRK